MQCYDEICGNSMDASKVKICRQENGKRESGVSEMQCYCEICENLMAASKVKIFQEEDEKKKKKNPAELNPPLRFVRPEWFRHPIYWCPRDEFFCYRHDEICEQVESVLRLLDPNYSFPHVEDEKKNKQEDEQPGMDLTLVFEEENKEEAEEVQEEPQEEPHKSKSKNKNKRKKQEDE
ncbi:hypothetical protein OROHE_015391 [Orobanche hederae]